MTNQFQNRLNGRDGVRSLHCGRHSSDYLSSLDTTLFLASFAAVGSFSRNQVGGIKPYRHNKLKSPEIIAEDVYRITGEPVQYVHRGARSETNGREVYFVHTDRSFYKVTAREKGSKVLQVKKIL